VSSFWFDRIKIPTAIVVHHSNQVALWINSALGYAYALMEPEEQIKVQWGHVCASWKEVGDKKLAVPFCAPVSSLLAPPTWWNDRGRVAGKQAWQKLVSQQEAHLKKLEEMDERSSDAEGEEGPPPTRQQSPRAEAARVNVPAEQPRPPTASRRLDGPPQSPRHLLPEATGASASMSTAPTRTSMAPPVTSTGPAAPPTLKRPIAAAGSGLEQGGAASRSKDGATEQKSDADAGAAGNPPAKRSRVMTPAELAGTASSSTAVGLPGKTASTDRPQGESARSEHHRLSTYQANAALCITTGGKVAGIDVVSESSSPLEQGRRVTTEVRVTLT
jgi:hypothetical protein